MKNTTNVNSVTLFTIPSVFHEGEEKTDVLALKIGQEQLHSRLLRN